MSSKKNLTKATGGVLLAALMPLAALAQSGPAAGGNQTPRLATGDFCKNVEAAKEAVMAKIEAQAEAAEARREERREGFGENRGERQEKLQEGRGEADEKRAEAHARLEEMAKTDAQVAAIAEFQKTVESLVATRRAAIDDAIAAFEDAVEELAGTELGSIDNLQGNIAYQVAAAYDSAIDDCDKDDDNAAEIRAALQTQLQSIRGNFQNREKTYTVKEEFEAARAERKAAVEAAVAAFKAGMDEAKAELRAAFSAE